MGRYLAVLCALYVLLILAGVHTSSIGVLTEGGRPAKGVLTGTPRPIRSDEFLRSSPAQIGNRRFTRREGTSADAVMSTPLDAGYGATSLGVVAQPGPPAGRTISWYLNKFMNLDSAVSRKLPILQDFTATWWRGTFYLFVGVALFFSALGLSWRWALAASLMVWFSPANQWWSLWPLESFGVATLAAGLLLRALAASTRDVSALSWRRRVLHVSGTFALFGAAAVFGLRLPSSYQPWSLASTSVMAAIAIGALCAGGYSWVRMKWYLITGLVGLVAAALPVVLRLRNSLNVMLSTVYPGVRRFNGLTGYPRWGATLNWELQRAASAAVNQSELSIGHVVLIVPVLIVAVIARRQPRVRLYWPLALGTGTTSVFYLWTLATWPHWLSAITFLDRIPPDRALQIIGVIVPILYVLAIAVARGGGVTPDQRMALAICTFVLVVVLTLQDGSMLRSMLPWVGVPALWWTSLVTGALIAWPFLNRLFKSSMVLIVAAVVLSGINVNPWMQGLGILGHSKSQVALARAIRTDDRRWASDSIMLDPLAVAAGMRVLSGNQGSGPNREAYRVLDPLELDANKWNRAGSYVTFSWTQGDEVVFANPSPDVVQIQIDPCNPLLDTFDLVWVASSGDQPGHPCLQLWAMFPYQDMTIRLYERNVKP